MTKRNRRLGQRGAGESIAGREQLARPPLAAAARWKMAIATFVGAYIVTAIAIPRELGWLPHSWSFYEINIITNIIMAAAMTWVILPGMSRLLRSWLYGSHDGTPVRRPATVTVQVTAAAARAAPATGDRPAVRGLTATGKDRHA